MTRPSAFAVPLLALLLAFAPAAARAQDAAPVSGPVVLERAEVPVAPAAHKSTGQKIAESLRAKGLSENKVIYHHAFRNTLIPLVTMLGGSLPGLFAGALITETLYSIPGIGYVSYQSMVAGDIPFSMFYLVFMAILTLLGNLISDILYAVVDPRVRIA